MLTTNHRCPGRIVWVSANMLCCAQGYHPMHAPMQMQEGHSFRQLCRQGNCELIRRMMEAGVNPDIAQDDGTTGLWLAAENGCTEALKLLLAHRANPDAVRNPGQVSALFIASQNGHTAEVENLLANGANPNLCKTTGSSPLFIASQQNFPDIARLLLQGGAKVDEPNGNGVTPLAVGAFRGNMMVVKHLLAAGADPLLPCQGRSSLEWAAAGGHKNEMQTVLDQHMRAVEAEVVRRRSDNSQQLASVVVKKSNPIVAAPHTPAPSTPMHPNATFNAPRAASTPFNVREPDTSDDIFAWYTPQFLASQRGGANRSMSPQAVQSFNTRSFSMPMSSAVGRMNQPTSGITREVLEEEARRAKDFRSSVRRSTHLKRRIDPTWESGGGKPSKPQLYSVEQEWMAHRDRLETMAQLASDNAEAVSDAWMYSAAATSTYSAQMLAVRRQMDSADRSNREQDKQSKDNQAAVGFQLPRTAPERFQSLCSFMAKGAGAKGPPPPLAPEEMVLPPPPPTFDDSSFGAAATNPEPERKLTAMERHRLKMAGKAA